MKPEPVRLASVYMCGMAQPNQDVALERIMAYRTLRDQVAAGQTDWEDCVQSARRTLRVAFSHRHQLRKLSK